MNCSSRVSPSRNRLFLYEIEWTGFPEGESNPSCPMRKGGRSNHKVRYEQMGQFNQKVTRLGGKIIKITPLVLEVSTSSEASFAEVGEILFSSSSLENQPSITESLITEEQPLIEESQTIPDSTTQEGYAWWLKITTAIPQCTYYFGPFVDRTTAHEEEQGYIEDLESENSQGINSTLVWDNPSQLTIYDQSLDKEWII